MESGLPTAPLEPQSPLRPPTRLDAPSGRRGLRSLSLRARLALLGAGLAVLTSAAVAARLAEALRARIAVAVLAVLALGLLSALGRLLAAPGRRRHGAHAASGRQAADPESPVDLRARELSALSSHLQAVSEREKSELARNLHDELGGLLTAAKMDLSWLQSRVPQPALQERLAQLGAVLDEAMDLKRRVVEDLRPSLLDHFGLPTALRAHVESACVQAGLRADLTLPEDGAPMSRDAAIALFRIVQEGITNIIRHAGAHSVTLRFHVEADACRLVLSDDGHGFDANDPGFRWSHGIMGMRQRVHALGGRFEIDSIPGAGTTVRVTVPVS